MTDANVGSGHSPETISIATGSWPVVVVTMPSELTDAGTQKLIAASDALFARRQRFAMITDTRRLSRVPGARERRKLGEWLVRPEQLENQRRWSVGNATVIDNPLVRGGLQAVYWVWSAPNPQLVVATVDEAWAFVAAKLAERGVELPQPLDQLRLAAERELAPGR
jgi:hypothetical protein